MFSATMARIMLRTNDDVESGKHTACRDGGMRLRRLLRWASRAEEERLMLLSNDVDDIIFAY